jgi:hypothetical protein
MVEYKCSIQADQSVWHALTAASITVQIMLPPPHPSAKLGTTPMRVETLAFGICAALQRQNAEILKQIFPEKEYRGLSPNFHVHVSVSELYIPTMGLPVLLEEICILILGLYKSLIDT